MKRNNRQNSPKKPTHPHWSPSREGKIVAVCLWILFSLFTLIPLLPHLWNAWLR